MDSVLEGATEDEQAMLTDLVELSREPKTLEVLLARLNYRTQSIGTGWFAAGSTDLPILLFPLHTKTELALCRRQLLGRDVARNSTIAAGLAALRSVTVRPPLLFVGDNQSLLDSIEPARIISLQGGTVPRIWPGCFGRFDMLVRVTGRPAHPGQSDVAINVIEAIVPALEALLRLNVDLRDRDHCRQQIRDAPLRPRLTVNALHGGHSGAVLPGLVDLVVSRRYDPAENIEAAITEIEATLRNAIRPELSVELSVTDHQYPAPEKDAPPCSREQQALNTGWGWPQVPFCSSRPLVPGAVLFGGLERPDCDPGSNHAVTSMDDMTALARSLRTLLSSE